MRVPRRKKHMARVFTAFATGVFLACSSGSTSEPPDPTAAALEVASGNAQEATVATSTSSRPTVRVVDGDGAGMSGVHVTFSVDEGGGWVTDASVLTDGSGYAATTWYMGPAAGSAQQLTARAAGFSATLTATATPLVEGTTYRGTSQFLEFTPGDLPVIISAPHGGTLEPSSIPDRDAPGAVTVRDAATDDLALEMDDALVAVAGGAPHIIVMHLHRIKLDANREIGEAAEGNRAAEIAWREYHGFIDAAREHVAAEHGRGLYIDMHGHGHEIARLELGYLLSASELARDAAALNMSSTVRGSSIRRLAETGPSTHAELLRGAASLGTLLEAEGYPAVPSTSQPDPGGAPYFTGGYSTARHGSRDGGPIDGIQIEANRTGVRDTQANRQAFAAALARAIEAYFTAHYETPLAPAAVR